MTPKQDQEKENLIIFDTTLRDGEQSPGVNLNAEEKVEIAQQLSALGVDICEAGFPVASEGDFLAVEKIASIVGPITEGRKNGVEMKICALARCVEKDIELAYQSIKSAPRKRIHIFLATSDIHLEFKLKISREQCVQQVERATRLARSKVEDVEFSCEDAGRSEKEFLVKVINTAIEAGATTINIPDTVGFQTPEEYGSIIKYITENANSSNQEGEKITFSTHCHNDLGLATANTLAGIRNGARQVEVTVNGIGERAGNTSLEEIAMALYTHPSRFPVTSQIVTQQICKSSHLVSQKTGMMVQPNKAIVGVNAFAHESGIHQDGVLKYAQTYEIIKPETVGFKTNLVMGKHSGRHAFREEVKRLGFVVSDAVLEDGFQKFKKRSDTKKYFSDDDIKAIMSEE